MKIYTGTIKCRYCCKDIKWKFEDDGRSKVKNYPYMTSVLEPDKLKADGSVLCKRTVVISEKSEFLGGNCPDCGTPFAVECTEEMLKELYSK